MVSVAVRPLYPLAAKATGVITRHIAVAPRIGIELPQTGLEATLAAIRSQNVSQAPGNNLLAKAGIFAAVPLGAVVWATGPVVAALAIAAAVLALEEDRGRAEPIGSAAGISRAAVVETAMPSAVVPGDSTDPARVAAAAVARPAWAPEVEAASVVEAGAAVVVGADSGPDRNKDSYRSMI